MIDEAYIEMRCYIKYNLYYGQSEQTIRQNLINAGWPAEKISQAFAELKGIAPKKQEVKKAPAEKPKAAAAKPKPVKKQEKKEEPKEGLPEAPIAAPAPPGK